MAALSCAVAYVSGAAGSNACPAGSARIETEATCRTAAAAAGKTPSSNFVRTNSLVPRGCYYDTTYNSASFNTHAVGKRDPGAQPLCAAATTGARVSKGTLTGYSKGTQTRVLKNGYSKGTHCTHRVLARCL